jgi:hypothetical protein
MCESLLNIISKIGTNDVQIALSTHQQLGVTENDQCNRSKLCTGEAVQCQQEAASDSVVTFLQIDCHRRVAESCAATSVPASHNV